MKLWHDDVRPPPDKTWTWARTNDEAKALLRATDVNAGAESITEVSLDHDLGYAGPPPGPCEECGGVGTHDGWVCGACDGDGFIGGDILYVAGTSDDDGRKLVKWMIEEGYVPQKVTIHSWNPDGARAMAEMLRLHGHDPIVRPFELSRFKQR